MKGKGGGKLQGVYKSVIGKTVLVPASEFGVDVPQMYYKARVTKKDPSHSGAVVVKFMDDDSLAWMPVEHVLGWMKEADASDLSGTIGSEAQVFAAEVLTGLSGSSSRRAQDGTLAASSGAAAPQSAAQPPLSSRDPDSAASSQVSDMSVAALGYSSDEEECGEALSSLKGAARLQKGRRVASGSITGRQLRRRLAAVNYRD